MLLLVALTHQSYISFLSFHTISQPKVLMEYTGFDRHELYECMALVSRKISDPAICASRRQLTAVKKKYENRKYMSVAVALENPSVLYVKENDSSLDEDE